MNELNRKAYNNVIILYHNEYHTLNCNIKYHTCDDSCGNVYLIKESISHY